MQAQVMLQATAEAEAQVEIQQKPKTKRASIHKHNAKVGKRARCPSLSYKWLPSASTCVSCDVCNVLWAANLAAGRLCNPAHSDHLTACCNRLVCPHCPVQGSDEAEARLQTWHTNKVKLARGKAMAKEKAQANRHAKERQRLIAKLEVEQKTAEAFNLWLQGMWWFKTLFDIQW